MKKKILICTLCFTIIFSSLNIKKSYANPIIIGKVAEVSIIYSIGRIGLDLLGLVGDISDVMDIGNSIYSKMTDENKEDFKNNVKFDNEGFTYDDDKIQELIVPLLPSKGYHYLSPFKTIHNTKFYYDTEDNTKNIESIFNEHFKTIKYQGFEIEVLTYVYPRTGDSYNFRNYHRLKGGSLVVSSHIGTLDSIPNLEFSTLIQGDKAIIKMNYIYNNSVLNRYNLLSIYDTCDNCPHDISLKPSYTYPTKEEQDYIDENYPQYENDIPNLSNPDNDNNNGGNDNNNGGNDNNNGGNDNNNGGNDSIINNPPSFPQLEAFDFSGLQLEPLTNLFSNFKNKFPFSLPFDLANLVDGLTQDPIPPVFESDLFGETITLDLTQFTDLANILKAFTILGYLVSLILITKKFGG